MNEMIEMTEQEFEEVLDALYSRAIDDEVKYRIERHRYFTLYKAERYIKGKKNRYLKWLEFLVGLRTKSAKSMKLYGKMYKKQLEAKTKELWK